MDLTGRTALVTGGRRGVGAAIVTELLDRGVSTVYAAARTPWESSDARIVPLALDVTRDADVANAVALASEVSILVNNAGILTSADVLRGSLDDYRWEYEVNALGLLRMTRAFAPVLAAHGSSAVLNVHSVLSWLSTGNAYGAAKAAGWSLSNGLRAALAPAGTVVTALHMAYTDTDMGASFTGPKNSPGEVARQAVQGIVDEADEVLADDITRGVKQLLSGSPSRLGMA